MADMMDKHQGLPKGGPRNLCRSTCDEFSEAVDEAGPTAGGAVVCLVW